MALAERDLEVLHFRVVQDITRLAELAQTSGSSPWEEATLTEVGHVAQRIVTAIDFLRSHVAAVQTQPAPAVETLATRLLAFLEQVRRPGHAGLTGPLANIRAKFQIEPLKGAIS